MSFRQVSSFSSVFRTKISGSFKFDICKGAKRKVERFEVQKTEHLINIVKSRKDPILLPDKYYPQWLLPFSEFKLEPKDYDKKAYMGNDLPTPEEAVTLFRSLKRMNRYYNQERSLERYSKRELKADEKTEFPPNVHIEADEDLLFNSDEEELDGELIHLIQKENEREERGEISKDKEADKKEE